MSKAKERDSAVRELAEEVVRLCYGYFGTRYEDTDQATGEVEDLIRAFLASDAGRLEAEVLWEEVERMASGWTQRVPMHHGVARQMGQRVVDAFNALRAARDKET